MAWRILILAAAATLGAGCKGDPNSCSSALDGECDEPEFCDAGTDVTDCGDDSCDSALDGACDEPEFCTWGTDGTDCRAHYGGGGPGPGPGGGDPPPPMCTGSCAEGQFRCTGSILEQCVFLSGCFRWQQRQDCSGRFECRDLECVPTTGCTAGQTYPCVERGECRGGARDCINGIWGACTWAFGPSTETCDALDNDCDGAADNNLIPNNCPQQLGVCSGSVERCAPPNGMVCDQQVYSDRAMVSGSTYQGNETVCDGDDNDCDGQTDETAVCPINEQCMAGSCDCALGTHRCGQNCVDDNDINTCGTRCTPCPDDPNGTEGCDGVDCTVSCDMTYNDCSGVCLAETDPMGCGMSCTVCPTDMNGTATCDGMSCGLTCDMGYDLCNGVCALCPAGASTTHCTGQNCEARACLDEYRLCQAGIDCCPWQLDLVEQAIGLGRYTNLMVDSTGTAHVVYYNSFTDTIRYAQVTSAGVSTTSDVVTMVDTGLSGDVEVSAVRDPLGDIHVAYYDRTAGELMYTVNALGMWSMPAIVDTTMGDKGTGPKIALAPLGVHPRIAYFTSAAQLRYAEYDGMTWTTGDVLTETGHSVGLAVDGMDVPHISHYDGGELRYVTRPMTTWLGSTVTNPMMRNWGFDSVMQIDAFGNPHIAHWGYVNGETALMSVRLMSTWTTEIVYDNPAGDAGRYMAFVLDPSGFSHMSFESEGRPTYAYGDGPTWDISVVQDDSFAGWSSILVDGNDAPHVSFTLGDEVRWARSP